LSAISRFAPFQRLFKKHGFSPDTDLARVWNTANPTPVEHCPLGVPETFRKPAMMKRKEREPRQDPAMRYPDLAKQMRKGSVKTATLEEAAKDHLSRRPVIAAFDTDGSVCFFNGSTRGDKEYSRKMGAEITKASEQMLKIPGDAQFHTITHHASRYSRNIFSAIKTHKRIVSRYLRKCRKLGGCHYISVLEITEHGYPHTHLIIKWENRFFEHYLGPKGEWFLKDKKFYYMLKSWQPAYEFRVVKVRDKCVREYLAKYVSKGMFDAVNGEKPLTKEEKIEHRKSLMCYMFGYMTHSRQFRISEALRHPPERLRVSEISGDKDLIDALNELCIVSDKNANALISLLNNLTDVCRAHAWAIFNSAAKTDFSQMIGYHEHFPPDKKELFFQNAAPLGCPGCILTQIVDNLLHPEDEKPPENRENPKVA
jgi:hypothetical protein